MSPNISESAQRDCNIGTGPPRYGLCVPLIFHKCISILLRMTTVTIPKKLTG